MLANRAGGEIVLAVDIHAGRSAERHKHRPGNDRRPPAILQAMLPELAYGHARLDTDQPGRRVPLQDTVHAGEIENNPFGVQRCIPVAHARAA